MPSRLPPPAASAADVVRIRFGTAAPPGLASSFRLDSPEAAVAWEESASRSDLTTADDGGLVIASFSKSAGDAAAGSTVTVLGKRGTVHWKPGAAVFEGAWELTPEMRQAVAQFAYLESQLREMERELAECEKDLSADIGRGLKIRDQDVHHVERFAALSQRCYALWMTHARWAERFSRPTPSLPLAARRLMATLMKRADLEARSEALDQRLEVCTELYEGATDRVADYRWYRGGHRLEVTIVWLLIVEIVFLAADFGFRIFEYYQAE